MVGSAGKCCINAGVNWSDLPFFLAVARSGQIARAAASLGSDPTTVGRRIRRLERNLGQRLFEQGAAGQTLTSAGNLLLAQVTKMAEIASDIGSAPKAASSDIHGAVRVSVAEGFGTWFISRHLETLLERHPALQVDLVANSGFLNPTRRETDIAVLLARPRRGPLFTRKLTDYALGLYAASDYLRSNPAIGDAAALRQHRQIGYIPDIIYAPELRYAEDEALGLSPQIRSSSINAQHQMVAAGLGLGILPRFIGDQDISLRRILPSVEIRRSFWLVTHHETRNFPAVIAFSRWLTDVVGQHQTELLG